MITSRAVVRALPSAPISGVPDGGWLETELQLYRHPPGSVTRPGARDHVLVLNMSGKAVVDEVVDGDRETKTADVGTFTLTPAGRPVVRSWAGRPEVLLLFLKTAVVDGVAHDLGVRPIDATSRPLLAVPDSYVHALGTLLRDEALKPDCGSAIVVDSITRALTVHLLRTHLRGELRIGPSDPALEDARLARIVEFMRAHLDENLPLGALAERSGLSATHFARSFRNAFGKSPHAYLIDLRLEKAMALLEQTHLPVTHIAFICGFEQSQYFASAFRRKVGVSPSAWRMQAVAGALKRSD